MNTTQLSQYRETLLPEAPSAVPARRTVPVFAPIRLRATGRHRLRQAVRHRPGALAAGVVVTVTALAGAAGLATGPPSTAQCLNHP
jgi:hypothetical protein